MENRSRSHATGLVSISRNPHTHLRVWPWAWFKWSCNAHTQITSFPFGHAKVCSCCFKAHPILWAARRKRYMPRSLTSSGTNPLPIKFCIMLCRDIVWPGLFYDIHDPVCCRNFGDVYSARLFVLIFMILSAVGVTVFINGFKYLLRLVQFSGFPVILKFLFLAILKHISISASASWFLTNRINRIFRGVLATWFLTNRINQISRISRCVLASWFLTKRMNWISRISRSFWAPLFLAKQTSWISQCFLAPWFLTNRITQISWISRSFLAPWFRTNRINRIRGISRSFLAPWFLTNRINRISRISRGFFAPGCLTPDKLEKPDFPMLFGPMVPAKPDMPDILGFLASWFLINRIPRSLTSSGSNQRRGSNPLADGGWIPTTSNCEARICFFKHAARAQTNNRQRGDSNPCGQSPMDLSPSP